MVVFSADFCFFSAMLKKKKHPPFSIKKKRGFFDKKVGFSAFSGCQKVGSAEPMCAWFIDQNSFIAHRLKAPGLIHGMANLPANTL